MGESGSDRNASDGPAPPRPAARASAWAGRGLRAVLATWPVRGYRQADAGHLVAIVAFNGLVALAPTLLLLAAVAGLVLRDEGALTAAVHAVLWALPAVEARDAVEAVLHGERAPDS